GLSGRESDIEDNTEELFGELFGRENDAEDDNIVELFGREGDMDRKDDDSKEFCRVDDAREL
ncbi:17068_t:CDS:2, partial [Racocetra fulgida]